MTSSNSRPHIVDLSTFDGSSLDRMRPKQVEIAWWLFKLLFIQSCFPWPSGLKRCVLLLFGAQVGRGFYMRPGVDIHFPWKLSLGDNVWIGDRCTILNLAPVHIASNSALAHEVYLAAAGHDIRSSTFAYDNQPIVIESGVWVGTRSFVGPGVTIRHNAVVAAGSVVVKDVDPGTVVGGVPSKKIMMRDVVWGERV